MTHNTKCPKCGNYTYFEGTFHTPPTMCNCYQNLTQEIGGNETDRLKARIKELESQLAKRDAVIKKITQLIAEKVRK